MGPKRADPLASARSIVQRCMVRDFCKNAGAATIRPAAANDSEAHRDGPITMTEPPPPISECYSRPITSSTAPSHGRVIVPLLSCIAILVWLVSAVLGYP